jgi:hypothetical protein
MCDRSRFGEATVLKSDRVPKTLIRKIGIWCVCALILSEVNITMEWHPRITRRNQPNEVNAKKLCRHGPSQKWRVSNMVLAQEQCPQTLGTVNINDDSAWTIVHELQCLKSTLKIANINEDIAQNTLTALNLGPPQQHSICNCAVPSIQ